MWKVKMSLQKVRGRNRKIFFIQKKFFKKLHGFFCWKSPLVDDKDYQNQYAKPSEVRTTGTGFLFEIKGAPPNLKSHKW